MVNLLVKLNFESLKEELDMHLIHTVVELVIVVLQLMYLHAIQLEQVA